MTIPDFQTAMLPILRLATDGKDHRLAETVEVIAHDANPLRVAVQELLEHATIDMTVR